MSCNLEIHDGLKEMGHLVCDLSDLKLYDYKLKQEDPCCDNMDLIKGNGMSICKLSGIVDSFNEVNEYKDFYKNQYRFRRKSVYHRKHHTENVLNTLINLTFHDKNDLICDFKKVESAINNLYSRKRYIQIKFVFYKLLQKKGDKKYGEVC